MFLIDINSKIPIFEQLKKQILDFIGLGILSSNDQLPSVRSLANELGINPNTVSKAYQELEETGYIYRIKGKGCFVSASQNEAAVRNDKLKELELKVQEMKKLQFTKNDLIELINNIYREENI